MEAFNVMLVHPEGFDHIEAFANAARQLCNGLRKLGHPARVASNSLVWDATNVIVGAHLLEEELITQLPANSIIYNVEMVVSGSPFIRALLPFVRRFETWDYSEENIASWRQAGIDGALRLLKPGYLPENTKMGHGTDADIDALFYGTVNWRRDAIFADIARFGVKIYVATDAYGAERTALIARSKLVLNVHSREDSVLELGRIAEPFANRRVVVTDAQDYDARDADLFAAMVSGKPSELGALCRELLDDDERRKDIAERAFIAYSKRDFTVHLQDLLTSRAASRAAVARSSPEPS